MKSITYEKRGVRCATPPKLLLTPNLSKSINGLRDLEELGVACPYYVWGGQPAGLATLPIRCRLFRWPRPTPNDTAGRWGGQL